MQRPRASSTAAPTAKTFPRLVDRCRIGTVKDGLRTDDAAGQRGGAAIVEGLLDGKTSSTRPIKLLFRPTQKCSLVISLTRPTCTSPTAVTMTSTLQIF